MSMVSLLARHGVDAPRVITATGGLSIGGSAQGLQVAPHTFHGGDEPTPVAGDGVPWWHDEAALKRERAEMNVWFPGFVELEVDGDAPPVWFGSIDTGRGIRDVVVGHRTDHSLPVVMPVKPVARRPKNGKLIQSPHLYTTGNLCVADTADWDPSIHTAATVVAWAAHWYACHMDWLLLGVWPSDGYSVAA